MFDVSFSELVVIAVVALIVIGPEKLPKVARALGVLAGRMQRYVATVKEDISREMQLEDLQKLQRELRQGAELAQAEMSEVQASLGQKVHEAEHSIGGARVQPKKPDAATQ